MMLSKRYSGLLVPGVFALVGLIILIMLGNWQMQRRAWKAELNSLVEARINGEPLSLKEVKAKAEGGDDIRYLPLQVTGRFDHKNERHYFLPYKGRVGWHILTPLKTIDGDVLLVNRGFVPDKFKSSSLRADGLVEGEVTLKGFVRLSEPRNYFTPENDTQNNKWYWRDVEGLYASLDAGGVTALPFMIDAAKSAKVGSLPIPGVTKVKFKDPHLGYALTWYGLALTLVGVFLAFSFVRLHGTSAE